MVPRAIDIERHEHLLDFEGGSGCGGKFKTLWAGLHAWGLRAGVVSQLVLVGDRREAIVMSKNLALGRPECGGSQRRDSVVCPVQGVGDAQRDVFEHEPHGERHRHYCALLQKRSAKCAVRIQSPINGVGGWGPGGSPRRRALNGSAGSQRRRI
jgi:hypothetical protein